MQNAAGQLAELQLDVNENRDEDRQLDKTKRRAQLEKNDMYRKFETAVRQLTTRAQEKNAILDNKLGVL